MCLEALAEQRHVFFIFVATSPPTTTVWPTQVTRKGGSAHTEPEGGGGWGSQEGSVSKACLPLAVRAEPQRWESKPNCKSWEDQVGASD